MSFSQSGLPLPLPSSSSSHRLNSGLSSAPSSSNLTAAPQPNSHTLVQPNSHAHAHAQAPRKSLGFGLDSYSPVTNIDHYNMLGCIGQGSFGVIHKIQRKSDGTVSGNRAPSVLFLLSFSLVSFGFFVLYFARKIQDFCYRLLDSSIFHLDVRACNFCLLCFCIDNAPI